MKWNLANTYVSLPPSLYHRQLPVPVRQPTLVLFNEALASELGLGGYEERDMAVLAGNAVPPGADPIAQAYCGHQYGHFTTLGDGRAILLGEQITPSGAKFDIQLKGSGQTPYSRSGDGRAALGPMLREYIVSEAMHALGVATTRSLAVVTTGEPVFRETTLIGAVLTRVAASHIRVGTFQFAALSENPATLKALTDYVIARHYSELVGHTSPALALLEAVGDRQARLVAKWLEVGFIHGVMNTDNVEVAGETIDYGPCAFMDTFDPATVYSSIDRRGRYAYGNQPSIAFWNLQRFAEALLPLIDADAEKAKEMAIAVLQKFIPTFEEYWMAGMRKKLGLPAGDEKDDVLVQELLALMKFHAADYTNTFRALSADRLPETPLFKSEAFLAWRTKWQTRANRTGMDAVNPAIIPRNHQVQAALVAAEQGDMTKTHALLQALESPFKTSPENELFRNPPAAHEVVTATFCGT